ncbi:MAG: signal recognition particle-docking protein FtsY [Candidatus Woesearchaeota archaeon]
MFKFLKEKLKSAISIFSQKAEKTAEEEPQEEPLKKVEPAKKPEHKPEGHKKEEQKPEQIKKQAESAPPIQKKLEEPKKPQEEKRVEPVKEEKKVEPIKRDPIQAEKKAAPVTEERGPAKREKKAEHIKEEQKAEPLKEVKKAEVKWEEEKVALTKEPATEEKTGFFQKIKERFTKQETKEEEPKAEEAKGIFQKLKEKVQTVSITEDKFNEMFWDLEVVLLENNVAVEVIDKMKQDLKGQIVDKPIRRGSIEDTITKSLTRSVEDLFKEFKPTDLVESAKKKKPYVICFVGVNGSGKTTTIAKVAYLFKQHSLSVVIAAADTFRAAAIDQLEVHADKLGVRLIKHDYGSDAAAVAFDAIKHAESKNKDVVLIDTAGRLHSNANLMDEMKKVVRVAKPDMVIFVGESITGNDCVEQARMFNEAVHLDGIILSKADIDEKGGAAISISYVTNKPILYIGTGQEYQDLKKFDPSIVIESLGLNS